MISKEKKIACVGNVIQSKTFSNSPSSTALLQYLVEKSLAEVQLKEGIIEMEFYGENDISDKTNPRVRVNVYNLRKRLNTYYEIEGKDDNCKLIIDKGQYNVRFEERKKKESKSFSIKQNRLFPYALAFLFFVLFVVQIIPEKKPPIWRNIIRNNKATTLYIADAFGMLSTIPSGKVGWIVDFSIHNLHDYYHFIQENPELKDTLRPANFTYINEVGALAARELEALFSNYNKTFDIRLTSKAEYSEITEGNLVYVGTPLKEKFISLFNDGNVYCKYERHHLHIEGHPNLKDTILSIHSAYTDPYDYAVVSRIKGPQDTEQFFFFSNHEIGNMSTFKNFTDKEWLKTFTKEKLNHKAYFTAVYRVYGKERVNMRMEEVLVVSF